MMSGRKVFLKYIKTAVIAAVMITALLLCACVKGNDEITSLDQLDEEGKVVAISTSTPEANKVMKEFRHAKIESYTDIFPAYQEVSTGKVDACISQRIQMERAIEHGVSGVRILDETYCDNTVAIAISRKSNIPDLKDKLNQFLKEKKEDGTLDDMYQRWAVDENYVMPYIPPADDPQYAVTVATTGTIEPWSFFVGTDLSGYDIELARRFAAWLGAGLHLKVYDFGGVISAAQSGDVDCVMSNLYYLPEYEEALDFSNPVMTVEVTAMVKDHGSAKNEEGFLQDSASSGHALHTVSAEGRHERASEGDRGSRIYRGAGSDQDGGHSAQPDLRCALPACIHRGDLLHPGGPAQRHREKGGAYVRPEEKEPRRYTEGGGPQMIELVHLEKKYENAVPLKDVNAVIKDGDVIAVIGPSGSGKSTLLYCINMLDRPTGGKILLDGEDITAHGKDLTGIRRRMGMVFQHFNLFSHLTVIENLMIPQMDILGRTEQEAYDTAMKHLIRVGLEGSELQYPDELSGGQQQRAAIARTLAMDPEVILLDEPTSALDPANLAEVQAVISDLAKSGRTMMIVTHGMEFARTISNRVFYMDQGVIYEDGTPEQIFDDPQKELTKRFIHNLKVLELHIGDKAAGFAAIDSELDRWCLKNNIPLNVKYRIRLTLEEIGQQMLPREGILPAHILAEYSREEDKATVMLSYSGARFDPADTDNRMSYDMLRKSVRDMSYTYDPDAELPNTVTVLI